MELTHSQLIDVMIEEYRHTVTRNISDPELRPARLGGTPLGLTAIRQRLSRVFADRLEPVGPGSHGTHLAVMPYSGGGSTTACSPFTTKR